MKPFLFITDLDNTLLGNDRALESLNQYLAKHRQQYGTKIVYFTERSLLGYKIMAEAKSLLNSDALITSMGTEIYFDPQFSQVDEEWMSILAEDWNREQIVGIAHKYKELQMQPLSEQNPFKISYYLSQSIATEVINNLRSALLEEGFDIKFIYNREQDLDLLPKNSDPSLAVNFLRKRWNFEAERTITCGDSKNDISLFIGEEKGIIVNNCHPKLRQWYQNNQRKSLYLANSNHGKGILEGLAYFGLL